MEHLSVVAIQLSANQCANGCLKSLPMRSACSMTWWAWLARVYQGYATQLDWEINRCQCHFQGKRNRQGIQQSLPLRPWTPPFWCYLHCFGSWAWLGRCHHKSANKLRLWRTTNTKLVSNQTGSYRSCQGKNRGLDGCYAINPGQWKRNSKSWIGGLCCLLSSEQGAVMAVPAHDQRDWGICQTIWPTNR